MNWEEAEAWEKKANQGKNINEIEPRWSWDCGLKLDFDGGLLRVSSRFYPMGDDMFKGSVSFCIGDTTYFEREFYGRHIEILKRDVEMYISAVRSQLEAFLSENQQFFIVHPSIENSLK